MGSSPGNQLGSIFSPVINGEGQPIAGANIAIAQPMLTTAATSSNGIATLVMAANPQTAGFVQGATIWVSGFTAADTGYNVGTFTQGVGITGGATIIAVTPTSILYAAPNASASASTSGSVLQQGNASTPPAGLVAIYSDPGLTQQQLQPLASDGGGNWNAFVWPGQYYLQFYSPAIQTELRLAYVGNVPGAPGPPGSPGATGPAGATPAVTANSTTTLPPAGSTLATAYVHVNAASTPTNVLLDFGIPAGVPGTGVGSPGPAGPAGPTGPAGATGPAGSAATINVGTVTTLPPSGSTLATATVTNAGTTAAAVFNFGIPAGLTGSSGAGGGGEGGALNFVEHYFSAYTSGSAPTNLSTGQGTNPITPALTPNLTCFFHFIVSSSLASNAIACSIYRTTAGIPPAGAAVGGSDIRVAIVNPTVVGASVEAGLGGAILDTAGATVGTACQYYLALTGTAGTITIHSDTYLQVVEIV